MASPSTTRPSSGIMPPVRITMRSPGFTSVTFVSTSVPSTCCQTFSTRRLMAEARSATDFLWVHSSRISPSCSMNMTEPAVAKSPRTIDTVTAVASSTATDSFRCHRARSPSLMYFAERITASAVVTGAGRNRLEAQRRITVRASLSSNSRFKAREVCSGAKSSFSAFSKENRASARIMRSRSTSYTTTASRVRS